MNWFSYVPNSLQAAFLKCHSLCQVWGGWCPAALTCDFYRGDSLNQEMSTPDPCLPSYSVVICMPQLNTSNLQAARFHGCLTLEKHIPVTNTKSCSQQQTPLLQLFLFCSWSVIAGSEREAFCFHSTCAQLRVMLLEHYLWFLKARSIRAGPSMLQQSITQILKSSATLVCMTFIAKANVNLSKEGLMHLILLKNKHRGYKPSSKT